MELSLADFIRSRSPKVKPGLTERQIIELENELAVMLPDDVRGLLAEVSEYEPIWSTGEPVRLAAPRHNEHPHPEAFPVHLHLADDGCGNFWFLDIDPRTGACGPVIFFCHDPPIYFLQFETLAEFIRESLERYFEDVDPYLRQMEAACVPPILPIHAALQSADPELQAFARTLDPPLQISDLRGKPLPLAFDWHVGEKDWRVLRWKHTRLFASER